MNGLLRIRDTTTLHSSEEKEKAERQDESQGNGHPHERVKGDY
jgi:hypothetical protein